MADKKNKPEKKKTKKADPKKDKKKYEKKVSKKKKAADKEPELRLSQLEQVELNLCDRDHELSLKEVELAEAQINNLTMNYHTKLSKLKEEKRTAQQKSEQLALIRNRKLSEIEARLRGIEPDFSFREYLEQDDGTLIKIEDKVIALDQATDGEGGSA